jgi:hypothetical protein
VLGADPWDVLNWPEWLVDDALDYLNTEAMVQKRKR